jgi:hypothetical protein
MARDEGSRFLTGLTMTSFLFLILGWIIGEIVEKPYYEYAHGTFLAYVIITICLFFFAMIVSIWESLYSS